MRKRDKPFWQHKSFDWRIYKVEYAAGLLHCTLHLGKRKVIYGLPVRSLKGARSDKIKSVRLDDLCGVVVTLPGGRETDFGADWLLYQCVPEYRTEVDTKFPPLDADAVHARLARNLCAVRKMRGMTQQDLASKTGIQRSNVCRMEKGKHSPRIDTLVRIAKALGVSVQNLVGSETP